MIDQRCRKCGIKANLASIGAEFSDLLEVVKFRAVLCSKCFLATKDFITNGIESYVDDEYE